MTLTPSDIARTLIDGLHSEDHGATVWLTTERFTGYLVGVPAVSRSISAAYHDAAPRREQVTISEWIEHLLERRGDFATVGSWLNPNGSGDYDACDWHADRAMALTLGRMRGELAIWDIAGNAPINVT